MVKRCPPKNRRHFLMVNYILKLKRMQMFIVNTNFFLKNMLSGHKIPFNSSVCIPEVLCCLHSVFLEEILKGHESTRCILAEPFLFFKSFFLSKELIHLLTKFVKECHPSFIYLSRLRCLDLILEPIHTFL